MFITLPNVDELSSSRRFETRDIVTRLGFLAPRNVRLVNYSIERPLAIFNPGGYIDKDKLVLYLRVIVGYYKYVSAIARIEIALEEILDRSFSQKIYDAEIVVYPSNRYDFWGTEDPRVTIVKNRLAMVYAGRTIKYFDVLSSFMPSAMHGKVLPILATSFDGRVWNKVAVFVHRPEIAKYIVADKDAFLYEAPDGSLWLFHRPDTATEDYFITVSRVGVEGNAGSEIREVVVRDTRTVLRVASFEWKAGWGTPLLEIGNGKYIAILHGVDRELKVYRAFIALLTYGSDGFTIERVSPYYIMEPKALEERYGDRPYVVFPTAIARVDNKILVVYGASDSFVGIGTIEVEQALEAVEVQ